ISDFDNAIKLEPRMAWAYQGRGIARTALNDLEAAMVDFSRALELDPKLLNAYLNRGLVLLLQGKDSEAAKDFARVLTLKPESKTELERRSELAKNLRSNKY
ncbi:MAG: hypothetical protein DMF75_11875, partial [Acidobacteria bacterium]